MSFDAGWCKGLVLLQGLFCWRCMAAVLECEHWLLPAAGDLALVTPSQVPSKYQHLRPTSLHAADVHQPGHLCHLGLPANGDRESALFSFRVCMQVAVIDEPRDGSSQLEG